MSLWINILLFVTALWLLLRIIKVVLRKSNYRRFIIYIERSEYLVWLVFGNWMLFNLLTDEPRIAWFLPISLSLLILYLYQEWIAGWLFKGFNPLQEGQHIKIGNHQGQITQITTRHIALKQAKGEIILPYAGILWRPVWYMQAQQKQSNRHRLHIYPVSGQEVEQLKTEIQERLWMYPAILVKPPPSIQISENDQGQAKVELWVSLLPGHSAAELQAYLTKK